LYKLKSQSLKFVPSYLWNTEVIMIFPNVTLTLLGVWIKNISKCYQLPRE
jgi:hypothetical protein